MERLDWIAAILAGISTGFVQQFLWRNLEWWGLVILFLVFAGFWGGILRIARGDLRR